MLRTLFSIATVACLVTVMPAPAWAAQQKPGAPAAQKKAAARSSAKAPVSGTININTASATELQTLPGIGARTAALIVEYRQKNGPFRKIEELMNVRGVGEKSFLKLKSNLAVGAPKSERSGAQQ